MVAWLHSLKDVALASTVQAFLASKIEGYGTLENLKIDTSARMIDVVLLLEGETSPVQIGLAGYEIAEENSQVLVRIAPESFTTSRPWLTRLLNSQVAGRTFPIPGKYATYLRQLAG